MTLADSGGLFPEGAPPGETAGPAASAGRRRMPEEARSLGRPWAPLSGDIPELTADLERDFRFGQSVFPFGTGYRLGGSLKGGSSTMWRPAPEADFRAYQAWRVREGVPESTEDIPAFEELAELLAGNQVEFWNLGHRATARRPADYVPGRGWIYRTVIDILRALPEAHLKRPEFGALQLGGWGPAAAKASAYENGRVFIYDFALGGAKRTMVGLFLHEMGHAHEAAFSRSTTAELSRLHSTVAENGQLLGLEFLLDAESRKVYQQFLVSEFIAETYVGYTGAAEMLRAFVAGQPPRSAGAWRRIYEIYRESFGGDEYE